MPRFLHSGATIFLVLLGAVAAVLAWPRWFGLIVLVAIAAFAVWMYLRHRPMRTIATGLSGYSSMDKSYVPIVGDGGGSHIPRHEHDASGWNPDADGGPAAHGGSNGGGGDGGSP